MIELDYSILAQIIKNILSISAANVDVEWVFNTDWDTYHYCWNHLDANIIEIIILIKWYEKLRLWTSE